MERFVALSSNVINTPLFQPPARMQNVSVFTRLKEAESNGASREELLDIFNSDAKLSIMNKKVFMTWLDEERPEQYVHEYTLEDFNEPPLNFEKTKSYVLIGGTGIGKTHYALAHFKNPCIISNKASLANISSKNDGLVFDDYSFHMCNPETVQNYADIEVSRTHDVKYGRIAIPKGLPRIFCFNSEDQLFPQNCPDVNREAIARRVCIVEYGNKQLFKGTPSFKSEQSLTGKRFKSSEEFHRASKRVASGLAPIFDSQISSSSGAEENQGHVHYPSPPQEDGWDGVGEITEEEFDKLQQSL